MQLGQPQPAWSGM